MSKKTQSYPPDLWLHIASDSLAKYVTAGGRLTVTGTADGDDAQLVIVFHGVTVDDNRLSRAFSALIATEEEHDETQPA